MFGGSVSSQRLTGLQSHITTTKAILESGDTTQISRLDREDLLGDMFYAGVLGYYAQLTGLSNVIGLRQQAMQNILLTGGTYGYVPQVNYFFGFPRSVQPGGVAMDLNREIVITGSLDGDTQKKFNMTQQVGVLGSILENVVPEQMFTSATNPGEAVSAVKLLTKAMQAGQQIYHLTQANMTTTLPKLNLSASVMSDIQAGLNAGKEVIAHINNLTVDGYTGAGYIIFDPTDGDGAYLIDGGLNGGYIAGLILGAVAGLLIMSLFVNPAISVVGAAFLVPLLAAVGVFAGIYFTLLSIFIWDKQARG